MTEAELMSLARGVAPRLPWTPGRPGLRRGLPMADIGEDWFLLLCPMGDSTIALHVFWGDHMVAAPSIYRVKCDPVDLRDALVKALRFIEGRIESAQSDINRTLQQMGA